MNRVLYIFLFFCTVSHGQIIDRFTLFPSASTTEYFENRAGAANPDSSTSIVGWVSGNATLSSSGAQTRTGTTAILITSSIEGTEQFKNFDFSSGLNSDLPDFVGGETVTVTGWVYAPSGATVRIALIGSNLSTTAITFTADTWTEFTFSGVSVTSSGDLVLRTNSAAYTYFDDLRVYETN